MKPLSLVFLLALLPAQALASTPGAERWSPELQEAEPYESPFVTFFNLLQQMSHHSMLTRDHFMLERIRELLKDADSIFVMYGSSHLATVRKALTHGSTRVVNKKYE